MLVIIGANLVLASKGWPSWVGVIFKLGFNLRWLIKPPGCWDIELIWIDWLWRGAKWLNPYSPLTVEGTIGILILEAGSIIFNGPTKDLFLKLELGLIWERVELGVVGVYVGMYDTGFWIVVWYFDIWEAEYIDCSGWLNGLFYVVIVIWLVP